MPCSSTAAPRHCSGPRALWTGSAFRGLDSPSVFGRLLGDEAGHWSVQPTGDWSGDPPLPGPDAGARDHVHHPGRHTGPDRRAGDGPGQRRGTRSGGDAPHMLVRRLAAPRARWRSTSSYALGPSTGSSCRCLRRRRRRDRARRRGVAGADHARAPDAAPRRRPPAPGTLARGRRCIRAAPLDLSRGAGPGLVAGRARRAARRHGRRVAQSWSAMHQTYDGPWRDLVHHSGRVLQGLSFQPERCDRGGRRRPRCPRASAGNATGTTATPGCATPASPWRRCGWRPARTRPDDFFAFMATGRRVGPPRRRPADHVRRRWRARPDRARAAAPRRLAGQPPGPGGQRRVGPAPDRRLRRAARRRAPAGGPAGRVGRRHRGGSWRLRRRRGGRWREKDQGIWEVRGEPRTSSTPR